MITAYCLTLFFLLKYTKIYYHVRRMLWLHCNQNAVFRIFLCPVPCVHPFIPTMRPRWNGHHLQATFSNAFPWMKIFVFWFILIQIWLNFGWIDNKPGLVWIMAWCRIGNKPLFELMLVEYSVAYIHHSAFMS